MPKGLQGFQKGNKLGNRFKKGHVNPPEWLEKMSKTWFKKGEHPSISTEFKKGHVNWCKGKHPVQLSGENNWRWNGGKAFDGRYTRVLNKNHPFANKQGYIYQHRLVIEKLIGRYILIEEKVHHIDKNKKNNHPTNLMLFISASAHRRFHKNPNNVKSEEIIFDGSKLEIGEFSNAN